MNIVSSSQPSRQWGPRCCCCVPAKDRVAHRQLNLLLRAAASEIHLSTAATGLAGLAAVLLLCHASPAQAHISITQPQQQQQAAVVQPTLPGSTAGFDPSAVGQIRGTAGWKGAVAQSPCHCGCTVPAAAFSTHRPAIQLCTAAGQCVTCRPTLTACVDHTNGDAGSVACVHVAVGSAKVSSPQAPVAHDGT
jgi:hypothetical protein